MWRFIPFQSNPASVNMAIDEVLLDQVISQQSPNVLRFYQWQRTTASIGYHQSLDAEVDVEFARNNNVDIVRRISGGGTVLHDSYNEITYAIICNVNDIPTLIQTKRNYDKSYNPND